MQTCGGGAPIGQGAYITLWKLKLIGGKIQSKKFYCQEHPATASKTLIISPNSPQAGPSNNSNYDNTFMPTQYSSSRKESIE